MKKPNTIGLGEYTNEDLLAELQQRNFLSDVTRFEVIHPVYGRTNIFWDKNLQLAISVQDENRTLKVFIDERTLPVSS